MIKDTLALYSEHLGYIVNQPFKKWKFGDSLLVPARNLAKTSLLNNSEIRPEIKKLKGVCCGGSFDFAKQFLDGELTVQRLTKIAKEYRTGVKIDAVQLQIFHTKNSKKMPISAELFVKDSLDGLLAEGMICEMESRIIGALFSEILNRNEESKALHIQQLKLLYESLENIEKLYPNESFVVAEFVKKYPNVDFLEQMINNVFKANNLQKFFEALNTEGDLTEILYSLFEMCDEGLKKKWNFDETVPHKQVGRWNERFNVAIERINYFRSISLMVNQTGLSLSQLDGLPMENDSDNVDKLKEVENGVYPLIFSTEEGRHAMLFIKLDGNHFLWDINMGLISLGKDNFSTNILKDLGIYEAPKDGKKTNHKLCIFKVTKAA